VLRLHVFTVTPGEGRLLVDVEVPEEAAPTLDGLAGMAERAGRTPAR
jgi:hypothetical protein